MPGAGNRDASVTEGLGRWRAGVDEAVSSNPLAIQPNMVDDVLRFSRPLVLAEVWILDLQGRIVLRRSGFTGSELLVGGLAATRYSVRVDESGAGSTMLSVVKLEASRE